MLFLLKIAVTPLLVAGVSLAARWWGPTVGGLLMGLPWFTGPTVFVLIQERGVDFGVATCIGIQIGVVCISVFVVTYSIVAKFAGWPLSMASACAAYFASTGVTQQLPPLPVSAQDLVAPLFVAAAAGSVALALGYALLPRPRGIAVPQALPWWDIPARMVATGTLVTVLLLTADFLGPQLSGIFASYPVIVSVVCTFTHHRWGRDAAWRMLRGLMLSLYGFVAFFLIVGLVLPVGGLIVSYVLAALVAVMMTSGLLVFNRVRVRHSLAGR